MSRTPPGRRRRKLRPARLKGVAAAHPGGQRTAQVGRLRGRQPPPGRAMRAPSRGNPTARPSSPRASPAASRRAGSGHAARYAAASSAWRRPTPRCSSSSRPSHLTAARSYRSGSWSSSSRQITKASSSAADPANWRPLPARPRDCRAPTPGDYLEAAVSGARDHGALSPMTCRRREGRRAAVVAVSSATNLREQFSHHCLEGEAPDRKRSDSAHLLVAVSVAHVLILASNQRARASSPTGLTLSRRPFLLSSIV
jgi:hypothetical protein